MEDCTGELTTVLRFAPEPVTAVVQTATGWTVPVENSRPAPCPVLGGTRWHRQA